MADQAQRSDVLQIAFATALYYRNDMIRVPKRSPADPLQSPAHEQFVPMRPARPLQVKVSRAAIHPADRANALIPREYLLAQIAGIRAKTPLMNTPIRAKRKSARGDFETAPAAERAPVLPFLQYGSIGKSAGHGPGSTHETFLAQIV